METGNDMHNIEFILSDYAEIASLQEWLSSTPQVHVLRRVGSSRVGEQGALDVLAVVAGSSGLVAAFRMIPEFLKSRRTSLSITTTVKGRQFTMRASNVADVIPILERLLNDQ